MKRIFLIFWLVSLFSAAFGQENGDVYFDKNYHKNKVINLPNMAVSQERWYVGIEGIFKKNYATLDNNLLGFLATNNTANFTWGIQLGYNFDNKWGIETGYLANIQETYLFINISRIAPITNQFTLSTIPIRYKKNIFTIDKATNTASLWLSGGLLISPNSADQQLNSRLIAGYSNLVRGTDNKVVSYDSVAIPINTFLTKKGLVQLELGLELQGKIAEGFNIVTFFRGNFGSNSIIHTDAQFITTPVNLTTNTVGASQTNAQSSLITNGFSYSFGLAFRYDVGRNVRYKNRTGE